MSDVQRIYVVSFAPSYDESGVGGLEWRRDFGEAMAALHAFTSDEPNAVVPKYETFGNDFRIVTLDLPAELTDDDIADFLTSGAGNELIEPPDPRGDLTDAIEAWRTP